MSGRHPDLSGPSGNSRAVRPHPAAGPSRGASSDMRRAALAAPAAPEQLHEAPGPQPRNGPGAQPGSERMHGTGTPRAGVP